MHYATARTNSVRRRLSPSTSYIRYKITKPQSIVPSFSRDHLLVRSEGQRWPRKHLDYSCICLQHSWIVYSETLFHAQLWNPRGPLSHLVLGHVGRDTNQGTAGLKKAVANKSYITKACCSVELPAVLVSSFIGMCSYYRHFIPNTSGRPISQ